MQPWAEHALRRVICCAGRKHTFVSMLAPRPSRQPRNGPQASSEAVACCRAKYEGKIATLTAINGGLQQEIDALHDQLEGAQEGTTNEELQELQEEFRRRLATSDRTIATLKVVYSRGRGVKLC